MSIDMFIDPGQDPRTDPPGEGSELATLTGFLDWYRWFMAGEDVPDRYSSKEDPDGDWDGAKPDPAVVEEAWQAWREEVAFAEQFVAAAPGLDLAEKRVDSWRGKLSLRWVLTHMVEEYARHIGHADLIRERIDGAVGQ